MAEVRRFADADELGRTLAAEIAAAQPRLLGCPGGRSLLTTYRHLPGLPETRLVMMDEYLPVPPTSAHFSCRGFAERELPRAREIWMPDPDDPPAYDDRIAEAGGIDLFLLASGASDGHVAMLGPGAPRDGRTSVVPLAESTRRDNLATFPEFESLGEVPTQGISVGLGTIADARALRMVIHGEDKRGAIDRLLSYERFDPEWPASIVHDHDDAEILLA
ncbi:MAG TPA: 6-phosphogluconolactonase [Gaiellaceae bacterium]|jgi:glucosamine-6-phosphate deaminase